MNNFLIWLNKKHSEYLDRYYFLEQNDENVFSGLKQIMRNGQLVWVVPKSNAVLDSQGNVTRPNDAYYVPANHPNTEFSVKTLRNMSNKQRQNSLPSKPSSIDTQKPNNQAVPFDNKQSPKWTPKTFSWMELEDAEKAKVLPGSPEWKQYEIYLRKFFIEIYGNDLKKWHPFARQAIGMEKINPSDVHHIYYFVYYSGKNGPDFNNWNNMQIIKSGLSLEQEKFQQDKIQELTKANGEQWKQWKIARIWAGLEQAKDQIEAELVEWFGIYINGKGFDVSKWTSNERNIFGIFIK